MKEEISQSAKAKLIDKDEVNAVVKKIANETFLYIEKRRLIKKRFGKRAMK